MFLRALAAIAVLLLASCGSAGLHIPSIKAYRMEIQQGNFVSQDMVSQLKPGMTKDQVRYVLGTPLITDSFHADRWDYVFRRQMANSNELEHRRIAVFFEDGKLKRVDGDVAPAADAGAAAVKAPQAQAAADKPAAQADAETSKAAPSAATPASPAQAQPQEKSWWQKLKEKF
jgi:outer membrane protein assembly factor BamE